MLPLNTLLPLLSAWALAPTTLALDRNELRNMIRLVRQDLYFSHLSPLITYEPADAWDITTERAYTTSPGARASFDWMGSQLHVTGGQMGARAEQSPPIDLVPSSSSSSSSSQRGGDQERWLVNTSNPMHNFSPLYSLYNVDTSLYYEFTQEMRTLGLLLPEGGQGEIDDPEGEGERGTHLNVTRVWVSTQLPRSNDEEDGGEFFHGFDVAAAVIGGNSSNPALEHGDEWAVAQGANLTGLSLTNGYMRTRNASDTWNTTSVLRTNQVNAGLRWPVPQGSSLIQVYGAVGPDHGRYELRLRNQTEVRIELGLHGDVIDGTAERPVESSSELLANAYLDPSTEYVAELVLVEEGKYLDVNGWMGYQYYRNPEEIDANWLKQYNDWVNSGGGLSGGQIAGIVIGSVAGAALIAGALWYFCWHKQRAQAKTYADDDRTLRESPTLNHKESV